MSPREVMAASVAMVAGDPKPEMFKLYRRDGRGLDYHEAWPVEGEVVEHWGRCGERGEMRRHPAVGRQATAAVLKQIRSSAAAQGFRPIAASRLIGLLVERRIDGFGKPSDLDLRHELEDFLNDALGWTGVGHCDGGSSGAGSMEAYCVVVDASLAERILAPLLAGSKFSGFKVKRA